MPTEPAGSIRGNWRQDSRCIQEAGREYSIQNYIDARILLGQCLCVVRGYFLTCTRGQLVYISWKIAQQVDKIGSLSS